MNDIPIIDVSDLRVESGGGLEAAKAIGAACREHGFFYISGHGINPKLIDRLERLSRAFFSQPLETKLKIRMELGASAWRGYFPVGGELTSGKADVKEGLYFGAELPGDHPLVLSRVPLHGPNLFPEITGFREAILEYLSAMTALGHCLMAGVSLSLGLDRDYFALHYTADPLVLFRIFNYPAAGFGTDEPDWGVGEHTDYGLLTILWQDRYGGLEIRSRTGWIAAPPIADTFVCNIGDMLELLTAGLYRSTPHRVKNPSGHDRLSLPFFFDPNFKSEVGLPRPRSIKDAAYKRWDGADLLDFTGTYEEYILGKISKVFPQLKQNLT